MRESRKTILAFTLTEMLVVMAIMVILMAVAIPAVKKLSASMEQSTGVISIIDAALSNARAIAVREQKYAGVRFQMDKAGKTYLVLIINDVDDSPNGTGLANGFRVVDGRKPIILPDTIGVIADEIYYSDLYMKNPLGRNEATTFSVVFSPSGQFVVHQVRVYSFDGKTNSNDTVFNDEIKILAGKALLRRDGDGNDPTDPDALAGYRQERSVQRIIVYDKRELANELQKPDPDCKPWLEYLAKLDKEHINPYTGELIRKN